MKIECTVKELKELLKKAHPECKSKCSKKEVCFNEKPISTKTA